MTLAEKLKERRNQLGWKQVTLSQKSGVLQATISRMESGKVTQPKMEQLRKIADALGVTIDYLAGDNLQMSFDDLSKDKQAQVVFRGWGKMSVGEKQQLADLVSFFEQRASKEAEQQ